MAMHYYYYYYHNKLTAMPSSWAFSSLAFNCLRKFISSSSKSESRLFFSILLTYQMHS